MTTSSQQSNTSTFSYKAPSITAVVPSNGPTTGGYAVTLFGSSFGLSAVTTFVSSQTGAVSVCAPVGIGQTHSQIQCTVPAGQGVFTRVFVNVSGQAS